MFFFNHFISTRGLVKLLLVLLVISVVLTACVSSLSTNFSTSTSNKTIATQDDSIRLTNGNWPPYNGQDLPHGGCDSWIVEEAFALEGITVFYGYFPWARSYDLSASGVWDGSVTWADTPEHRQQHYISAKPISSQEFVFFYRVDHPLRWQTIEDLQEKLIGITTGYVYNDAFINVLNDDRFHFIESSSDESNMKMLLAGRIDVFPIDRNVGEYLLHSLFTQEEQAQIKYSEKILSEFDSYLLLSKAEPKNEQLIQRYNTGFAKLQQSGRYDEIFHLCLSE